MSAASTSRKIFKNGISGLPVWHLVNAEGHSVGRLATEVSRILMGKHKPIYDPAVDCGDYVVIINAEKVHFTGKKWDQKVYHWHSGYPGGLKSVIAKDLLKKHPTQILERAILGMMPKNSLRRSRADKLKIYAGEKHPHEGQLSLRSTNTSPFAFSIPARVEPHYPRILPEGIEDKIGGWLYGFEYGPKDDVIIVEEKVDSPIEKARKRRADERARRVGEYKPSMKEIHHVPRKPGKSFPLPFVDLPPPKKSFELTAILKIDELPKSLSEFEALGEDDPEPIEEWIKRKEAQEKLKPQIEDEEEEPKKDNKSKK